MKYKILFAIAVLTAATIGVVYAFLAWPKQQELAKKQALLQDISKEVQSLSAEIKTQSHDLNSRLTGYDEEQVDSVSLQFEDFMGSVAECDAVHVHDFREDLLGQGCDISFVDTFLSEELYSVTGFKVTIRSTRVFPLSDGGYAGIVVWSKGEPLDTKSVVLFDVADAGNITNACAYTLMV